MIFVRSYVETKMYVSPLFKMGENPIDVPERNPEMLCSLGMHTGGFVKGDDVESECEIQDGDIALAGGRLGSLKVPGVLYRDFPEGGSRYACFFCNFGH